VPGELIRDVIARADQAEGGGGYRAAGLGFDLNGFAGGPRPRFGPDASCGQTQANPVEYPFTSYAGDVTFTEPRLGVRAVDFNTEGMIHIGLLPELIEDARRDGATDDDLEPLFRSAEAYIRTWERAEVIAARRRGQ
jgi:microsomal dipeptidase-like Zn-dependent dipeptidase